MRYAIDPTKLETELGWEPKYNFDTGIAQTIEWYLNNKEWWQNILSGEYAAVFKSMREEMAQEFIRNFVKEMQDLGYSKEELLAEVSAGF